MRTQQPAKCLLLDLPVELRLLIYDYALFSHDHVTIGTGLKPSFASPVDSGYASDDGRDSDELIPGLPSDFEPVVLPRFDPDFLHLEQPPIFDHCTRDQDEATAAAADDDDERDPIARLRAKLPFASPLALLQTNRQIRDELNWHLKSQRTQDRKLSLYMTYPYGLLVFQHLCPDLIRLARSVHISGYYYPTSAHGLVEGPPACQWIHRRYTQPPPIDVPVIQDANTALGLLTLTTLGEGPKIPVEELELRIYHPGPKGNDQIWRGENPSSPICVALRNTCGGLIDSSVLQGGRGAGAWLKIKPNEERRILTQRWRRFTDGNSKAECEGWIVNPEWPRIPQPSVVASGPSSPRQDDQSDAAEDAAAS
ncbi:uncharacterized protein BKCO1_1060001 [Diplodia corticola]|uniref:Uncharacterized protein n=1 Tax=Diplodia corticola TaxID=236234 RepID=A0A1J9RMP0_9PEZI|nr:uncharacterized protein BKCO1_1060001 [Diplodia corticola]OJD28869.1 hypothetical protein BKCO1_1060001 [Diplodia corticola]